MKNLFKTTFSLDEKKLSIAGVSKKWKNFHWPENLLTKVASSEFQKLEQSFA